MRYYKNKENKTVSCIKLLLIPNEVENEPRLRKKWENEPKLSQELNHDIDRLEEGSAS